MNNGGKMFDKIVNPMDSEIIQQDHESTLNGIGDSLIELQNNSFREGVKVQKIAWAKDFMACVKEHNGSLTILSMPEEMYNAIKYLAETK